MAFNPKNIHGLVDGTLDRAIIEINKNIKDPAPTFFRSIILDVITDPMSINENKIDYWVNVIGVSNPQFAKILPRNSIIGQRINTGVGELAEPMFLFPFFPSHLALPSKPGEMVWTMFEDPNARVKELGFWFCKITEPNFVEDVNHAHHARQLDETFSPGIAQQVAGAQPVYDLRNGKATVGNDGVRFVQSRSEILSSDNEEIFENLVTNSEAAQLMQYEAVPRFKKRPGDVALEGSNNTLIVLGTDRVSSAGNYENSLDSSNILSLSEDDMIKYAGSIDIVAGRGMKKDTGGTVVDTVKIADGQPLKEEIAKHQGAVSKFEGDPDLESDRSRILVAQRTMVDKNFGLSTYLGTIGVLDSQEVGDAAIVIKSDKVRIVSRSDVSLVVTNYTPAQDNDRSPEHKDESDNFSNDWASITIKSSGDIVFKPSKLGYIRLGGEDANQAILCTERPASTNNGTVAALPIATTAGGFVGTQGGKNVDMNAVSKKSKPDLGKFSTKVLIK